MKNFENRAKKVLTADGLEERYVDRRIVGYDELDKAKIINSTEISRMLVDTYGMFDLTELSYGVDEGEAQYLEEQGIRIPESEYEGVEIDFKNVVLEMAKKSLEILKDMASDRGKPFEAEVVAFFSPSEYNFMTDDYEMYITANPFDSVDELKEFLKNMIEEPYGNGGMTLDSHYSDEMYEFLNDYMYENITGWNIRKDGEYRENLSLDDLEKLYGKAGK